MEKYADPATHIGAWTAFFGGLAAEQVAAYGGLLVAVCGLLINWYYKAKEDRRREREVNAKLKE